MSEDRPSDVLGALPRTRPHRRSDKRGARPSQAETADPSEARATVAAGTKPTGSTTKPDAQGAAGTKPTASPTKQDAKGAARTRPAKPQRSAERTPSAVRPRAEPERTGILGTAVQAAAELAEIGLSASARALRGAVSRLPRA